MKSLNKVIINGNLTRDIEVSYTNTGFAIGKMSVAINNQKKEGDKYVDDPSFIDCVLFGKRVESLQQYLLKGLNINIEGHLKQERWEQGGVKRSKVSVQVEDIYFTGKRSDSTKNKQQNNNSGNPPMDERFDDDIPFSPDV